MAKKTIDWSLDWLKYDKDTNSYSFPIPKGYTLGKIFDIARAYGWKGSMEDLAAYNKISDPNYILEGLIFYIPDGLSLLDLHNIENFKKESAKTKEYVQDVQESRRQGAEERQLPELEIAQQKLQELQYLLYQQDLNNKALNSLMILGGLYTAPLATVGAIAGGKATDQITSSLSNGLYRTYSDWLRTNESFNNEVTGPTAELLNPGYFVGGTAGGIIGTNIVPFIHRPVYGQVKYYGPTMGKTTAAKTNLKLVDFDDIVREDIKKLAESKNISVKQLKTESGPEYTKLLEDAIIKWQSNPNNQNKTLVVSNAALSNKTNLFNNIPMIPSRDQFIKRLMQRGGGTYEEAAQYYDDLLKRNPNLLIEDKFVSDLELKYKGGTINYLKFFK